MSPNWELFVVKQTLYFKDEQFVHESWVPFLESPENLSGPKSYFLKLRSTYSVKLVFSRVLKG